jgi:large subunit ribosomal protein L25
MVANATLTAQPRTGAGKSVVRKLRAVGRTPAVLYGHGEQTRQLTVDTHELGVLFSRIPVESTIIQLSVEGEGDVRALVREVQIQPSSRRILHVDFYQVHAGERIDVEVPLHFVGAAAGVKAGGILHPNFNVLPIRCLSEQIPEAIDVDVSALEIGDSLHASQLVLPAGAITDMDPEAVLCSVTPPAVVVVEVPAEAEEAAAAEAAAAPAEPEVIRRRPEKEEEE